MFILSNNKAQCLLGTMFGKLDAKMVCVGSVVVKRKQGLSNEKAEKATGNVVDLPADALEGYALELLLKRLASATKKQFHLIPIVIEILTKKRFETSEETSQPFSRRKRIDPVHSQNILD